MRVIILLVLSILFFKTRGQNNQTKINRGNSSYDFGVIMKKNAEIHPREFSRFNSPPGNPLPISTLKNPKSLSAFIHKQSNQTITSNGSKSSFQHNSILSNGPVCKDSSFEKLIGLTNSLMYVSSIVHTKDDGVLIVGELYDSTIYRGPAYLNGFIVKTDNDGNVSWTKLFKDGNNDLISGLYFNTVTELQNGDIILAGSIDTTGIGFKTATIIFRIDAIGNSIWYKSFVSILSVSSQWVPVDIRTITEGPNGDIILCGTSMNNSSELIETVARMDNSGNILWDANFGNYGGSYKLGAEGLGAFYQNGEIVEVGITHGDEILNPTAVNFLTLDYTTGKTLSRRFFIFDYSDPTVRLKKQFTYYYNYCTLLQNGHYIIYGALFSDFDQTTNPVDHFGVLDFDAGQNLVTAYSISSSISSNYFADRIFFDNHGNGAFMLVHYFANYSANTFFGTIRNHQFTNERVANYNNAIFGNTGSFGDNYKFCFFNDGGYMLGQDYLDINNPGGSLIEFRKMHDADTSSFCLGADSLFAVKIPIQIKENPNYPDLDTPIMNQMKPVSYNIIPGNNITSNNKNPCKQQNYCDTIKIHGPTVFCRTIQPQIFTAFKNTSCGSIVQWNIDSSVMSNSTILNDSSISITFKNNNWQGKIYAYLPAAHCALSVSDSVLLHIISVPQAVDLGPDTVLCSGNIMVLHAGPGFSSYQWQDGSIDSTYKVIQPGTYHVTANDFCGNNYHDTIIVKLAQFKLSLGSDTTKCNNDIIVLKATTGFNKYQWTPSDYAIQADSVSGFARVFPLIDTSYIVTAEKWAGCYVRDTIHINVQHSPVISLGNDSSICEGQHISLNAGTGFINYLWSTGENSETIKISQQGLYTVKASAANGCSSYDTIKILQVYPLPHFSLSNTADTILCDNQILSYNFTLSGATYQWSDGNISGTKTIHVPGNYWLAVTQQGCTKYDTVHVIFRQSPVVYLGNDTSLCDPAKKILDATIANASYLWQDGSTAAIYTVDKSGTYSVIVNLNGCISADTINISYLLKPDFTLGKDSFLCEGQQLLLQPSINSTVNYLWQDGSSHPFYIVKEPGMYTLSASNTCGSTTNSLFIQAGLCKLQMPNAFTPNGDGRNDLFRVKYLFAVKQFKMQIFNRWGQLIFETNDVSKGWDGTFNGAEQPVGGYVWFIFLTEKNNAKQTSNGTVLLIR